MSKHCSFPKAPTPKWTKLKDSDLVKYFDSELTKRTGLTIREWDAYNTAKKRIDPIAYQAERQKAFQASRIRQAKEHLSIAELEQIIAEKKETNL